MKTELLDELKPGEKAVILEMSINADMGKRLMDLGFISGEEIEFFSKSILGDPKAFLIKGAVVALRKNDCRKIKVKRIE